jgi:hypothetical protein
MQTGKVSESSYAAHPRLGALATAHAHRVAPCVTYSQGNLRRRRPSNTLPGFFKFLPPALIPWVRHPGDFLRAPATADGLPRTATDNHGRERSR